ncbi:MAG: Ig-like domain-containing protein [Cellvibrio sp.]|uniref:Ig-like domain-containing protein n=1 Tax=Cellvibrio sp. TaxID=1965322 RepID=UPI002720DC30|nr:Ig-like domain-containing protein [Cellvibrio sp.]
MELNWKSARNGESNFQSGLGALTSFMSSLGGRSIACILVFLISLLANSYVAAAPSISSVVINAPLENGKKVSYGGFEVQISFETNYDGASSSKMSYQILEQKDAGAWVLINPLGGGGTPSSGGYSNMDIARWFTSVKVKPVPIGKYKYKLQVRNNYLRTAWSAAIESDEVEIRAPRVAPSTSPSSFYVYSAGDQSFLIESGNQYTFKDPDANLRFAWSSVKNDIPLPDLYYEFRHRLLGSENWSTYIRDPNKNALFALWRPQPGAIIGMHDMQTYEFSVRACNPQGCGPDRFLEKPIYLDYPEITSSVFDSSLSIKVHDLSDDVIKIQNFCFANSETRKCHAKYVRVTGSASGLTGGSTLYLYKGVESSKSASGSLSNLSVVSNFVDLEVGSYVFSVTGAGKASGVNLRKRFHVFVPVSGSIFSTPCLIDLQSDSCQSEVNVEWNGDYPVCLYQTIKGQRKEIECFPSNSGSAQLYLSTTVDVSTLELEAKEPVGNRVFASHKLISSYAGVELSVTPERCDIIRPATKCNAAVSWSVIGDYISCLYQNTTKIACSNNGNLNISLSASSTTFTLKDGDGANAKNLIHKTVRAMRPPTGKLELAPGAINPCVPTNGATCEIAITMQHFGGHMGVTLYKNEIAWGNLGTSAESDPFTHTTKLPVDAVGTKYSLRATYDGAMYEFANIFLYPSTYQNQGYSLTSTAAECIYDPLNESGCNLNVIWSMPTTGACIFLAGAKTGFCPDETMLDDRTTVKRPEGSYLFQLRKGSSPDSELLAQVQLKSVQSQAAKIIVTAKACYLDYCLVNLSIFTNYEGNVCLYDNGSKVTSMCGLNGNMYINDFKVTREDHNFQLFLVPSQENMKSLLSEHSISLYRDPGTYKDLVVSECRMSSGVCEVDISWHAFIEGICVYSKLSNKLISCPRGVGGKNLTVNVDQNTGNLFQLRHDSGGSSDLLKEFQVNLPDVVIPIDGSGALPTPVLSGEDMDGDCYYAVNLNAPLNVNSGHIYEIYQRKVGVDSWTAQPVATRSTGFSSPNTPPFRFVRSSQEPGQYEYKSKVCDKATTQCGEFSDVFTVEVLPGCSLLPSPTVTVINPLINSEHGFDDEVSIIASVVPTQGVSINSVAFYQDGNLLGIDVAAPYELKWKPTRLGPQNIMAKAEASNGATAVSNWIPIIINQFSPISTDPKAILLSPSSTQIETVTAGSTVYLYADVFDQVLRSWKNKDGNSPKIIYYINGAPLLNEGDRRAGEVVVWQPPALGRYNVKAVAELDEGLKLETVESQFDVIESQTVTLAIQVIGSLNAGSTIELVANVTDPDQQTTHVTFYANGEPVGKTSEALPYKTRWTPTVAGNYALTAKLIDKHSNEIISAVKNVVVEPSLFSVDGSNLVSDFGDTTNQRWRAMPLEQSDVLSVGLANSSRISYNKLGKLQINRPLKIINRSDLYDNEIVPQLIVLDADQIELNSSIEIVGEPADLLILNATVTNAIRCKNCSFINVERAVLAVATPASPLSSAMTQVGQLQTRAAGVVDVDNLQASGAVSLEIIADRVITKGHINTQQYARESTEVNPRNNNLVEPVLDFITTPEVNSVVVGSGGVSLLQGSLAVNYETLALDSTVAGTGVMDLQATVSSGAINIFATDAIQLSGNLSTRSSHRAAQIYRGQLRAQDEQIQLKTIAQATTAPSLRIHGSVLSDAKVHMIGHSGEIKPDGGIRAAAVKTELIGQLLNQGYIHSYVRATSENPASDQVGIAIGAGTVDNRGEIQSMFNNAVGESSETTPHGEINIASVNDVYNRLGGLIKARKVNVVSEKGKIRNGSLYAFDGTAVGGKESTTAIKIAPHNTSLLSTHTALTFSASEPPVSNVTAVILGDEVTLDAAQSVENINPYTEPYTSEAVEISAATIEAENRANDVQIEALKKLSIVSDTYVLNSSAKLGVSESQSGNLLSIKAPAIRNERYYSRMVMESFSDHEKVQEQTNIEISNWAKGVQSRYGFYSPPGYIYSFAKAEFDFGATGDGLLNNISYVDLYGDLKVFGKGQITTRGISLEKLAYESGSTKIVSLPECIYHQYGRTCSLPSSTYSRTPEGKLIKQSPDNTLFAVNGEISAPANVFNARNDQSLTVLRQEVIAQYKEETMKEAIDYHNARGTAYIDSRCDVSSFDKEFESTIVIYQHFYSNDSNIKCFHQRAYDENRDPSKGDPPSTSDQVFTYTNITDLVNKKIVLMGSTLNQQINDYRAWREAAQATGN